jgi:anti-anti-sigma factor
MQLRYEILNNGVIRVYMPNSLDYSGVNSIYKEFTSLTANHKNPFLVDMSAVEFLSSVGIRMLLLSAKDLSKRGSGLIIYKPQPDVQLVLEAARVCQLIPVHTDINEAFKALTSTSINNAFKAFNSS